MSANQDKLAAAMAAWNAGDLAGYLDVYDDSVTLHGYAPAPMDKTAVTGFYRDVLANLTAPGTAAPQITLTHVAAAGDWVSCVFTMSGAQRGPFMGVPASGRPYRIGGITMMRLGPGGRVVERHASADFLGLMVQIGAIALPG